METFVSDCDDDAVRKLVAVPLPRRLQKHEFIILREPYCTPCHLRNTYDGGRATISKYEQVLLVEPP